MNHQNRGRPTAASNPKPQAIHEARIAALLTQEQAAELVYSTTRRWQEWEAGVHRMHPGLFELFRIKVQQDVVVVKAPLYLRGDFKTAVPATWDPQGFAELETLIFPGANATVRHAVVHLLRQDGHHRPTLFLPSAEDRDNAALTIDLNISVKVRMADAYTVQRQLLANLLANQG